MNKLIIALAAICIAIAAIFYVIKPKNEGLHIAIFLPAIHPAMDEIERGFKETMSHGNQTYTFDTFNAAGNKTLLRAQAEEMVHQKYDLVFTVGTLCSHTMHTLLEKQQSATPLVFSAIDNPESIGVTTSSRKQGAQVTGTYITDNFDAQLDYLRQVKPTTKTILFVYDPAHGTGMEKVRKELEAATKSKEITLKTAQIFASVDIAQKVESLLSTVDTVLIYTDHTIVSGVDALIKLCNQYGVTLYASDLNSERKELLLLLVCKNMSMANKARSKHLLSLMIIS